MGFTTVCFIS